MQDTAKLLYESVGDTEFKLNSYGDNQSAYIGLKQLNETCQQLMGTTPEKVIVNTTKGGNYLVEFTGNLEKMIKDQRVSLDESIDMVAECNGIDRSRMYIVLDESCVERINIPAAQELGIHFVRK